MDSRDLAQTIFLIGSRTGGPLIPLLGLKEDLEKSDARFRFVILGIRGGFEEQAAQSENLPLETLPEVKRRSIPAAFLPAPLRLPYRLLATIPDILMLAVRLALSTRKALLLIKRYRPVLILSMSNFLSVPIIWAAALENQRRRLTNLFNRMFGRKERIPVRIVLHQLDIENLTVQLTAPFVHSRSAGFPKEIPLPNRGTLRFPNPVRYHRFDELDQKKATRLLKESNLLPTGSRKPLLLVFGGGSGSEFINRWLLDSLTELCGFFRILHLTGFLQQAEFKTANHPGYLAAPGLNTLMPAALMAADIVMARAGMSTISELLYLRKNAYLIPIPGSHQEKNARLFGRYFRLLEQRDAGNWSARLIADSQAGYPEFDRVCWDYYTNENRYLFRDHILRLLHAGRLETATAQHSPPEVLAP